MKLLHLICSAAPESGGPIKAVLDFNSCLNDRIVPHIACLDAPDAPFLSRLGAAAIGLGPDRPDRRNAFQKHYGYTPRAIPWLSQHVDEFDAVLVHGLWNYAAFAASRVLPRAGVPYYVFPHGMMDPYFRRTNPLKHAAKQVSWSFIEGPLLANARSALFTAEDERRLARGEFAGFSTYKETVIGYGAVDSPPARPEDYEAFQAAVPGLQGAPYLLFLSRLHPKKGGDMLIDAFAAISRQYPQYHLVMAGPDDGHTRGRLERQVANAGLADRIHFPGPLFGDAKWGALHAADAFVLSSHQENFGIVLAEAMACGTPVLTTRSVNIWREIAASGGGLIKDATPAGARELLAEWLSRTSGEKAAMRSKARKGYETYFRIEKAAATLVDLLEGASVDAQSERPPDLGERLVPTERTLNALP